MDTLTKEVIGNNIVTLVLISILMLVTIWTALTYLDKTFIEKYKNTFDIACFLVIEPSLFYFDIPLWICSIIGFISGCYSISYHFNPSKNLLLLSLFLCSESYLFCMIPYTMSKLLDFTAEKSDMAMGIIAGGIALIYFIFISCKKYFSKKI